MQPWEHLETPIAGIAGLGAGTRHCSFLRHVLFASGRSSYWKRKKAKTRNRKTTVNDMKLETIKTDGLLKTQDFTHLRRVQEYPKHNGTSLRLAFPRALTRASREYLRGLRAAEIAAWELTGGDYLLSHDTRAA